MHSNLVRHHLIIRLAALVLLVVCFAQPRICAMEPEATAATAASRSEADEVRSVVDTTSWGMTRGQTARISVVNAPEPSEQGQRQMVFIRVVLFDAGGAVIAQSDEVAIAPGEFRSVDFNRDAISLAGEPGSGRLQTRAQLHYRSFSLVDRTQLIVWPTSIELIDNSTGQTTLMASQRPKEIGVIGSKLPVIAPSQMQSELPAVVYASRGLIGLTYGQTLRVNALYPGDPANPRRQSARNVRARLSLYDANGALLAQSPEATIAPGEFHSFDFDRADMSASGEPVGGRLQMRMSLEIAATDPFSLTQNPGARGLVAASFEVIDGSTGRTTAGGDWLGKGSDKFYR